MLRNSARILLIRKNLVFIAIGVIRLTVFAAVEPASIFSDHMVLQRGKPVPIWGTSTPNDRVHVEFAGQSRCTAADAAGHWKVVLEPMQVNTNAQMLTFYSEAFPATNQLSDIVIGDVWLCGGQSNMQMPLSRMDENEAILQQSARPLLRLLEVPPRVHTHPQDRFKASWKISSPETAPGFAAVGYMAGHRIQRETGVPIGLIECAVGSTSVECWVSGETLQSALFVPAIKKWIEVEARWNDDPDVRKKYTHKSHADDPSIHPHQSRTYPGGCYNAMLHPLLPFAFKGVFWYQGEANRDRSFQYRALFPAMVAEWRTQFEQPDLPFYVVQLPEMGKKPTLTGGDSPYAELREAQFLACEQDPLQEMAIIIDTDEQGALHPRNKQLPGERLALIALAKNYGKAVEYRSPLFREMRIEDSKAILRFDFISGGLMVGKRTGPTHTEVQPVDEPLANFYIAGADRIFHPAQAVIEEDTLIVSSDHVKKPVAVRYAWSNNPPRCNLYNTAGLPAAPFRTDDWPCVTAGKVEGDVLVIRP